MKDFTTLKKVELEAEIALYESAGIEVGEADVSTNAKRVEWLKNAQEEHGIAHTVTESDIENNPDLVKEDIAVGDVILVPATEEEEEETEEGSEEGDSEEEGEENSEEDDSDAGEEEQEEEDPQDVDGEEEDKAEVAEEGTIIAKIYKGKTVVDVRNRIISGKIYYDVVTPVETFTLSEEEFKAEVK